MCPLSHCALAVQASENERRDLLVSQRLRLCEVKRHRYHIFGDYLTSMLQPPDRLVKAQKLSRFPARPGNVRSSHRARRPRGLEGTPESTNRRGSVVRADSTKVQTARAAPPDLGGVREGGEAAQATKARRRNKSI